MRSADYWAKRMEELNEALLSKGDAYAADMKKEYQKALARITADTERWYGRLAANNEVSLADAKKLLTKGELKEFKWTVEEYIERGRENAIDQRWAKQLENASAKAHITRLEQIQVQIQNEVEQLAGRQQKGVTGLLGETYKDGYYHSVYELEKGKGFGTGFAKLDARQIDKTLAKPWAPDGRNFSSRIWADRTKLNSELQTTLTQSLINGSTSDKVIKDFAERMGVAESSARRLILTEAAYFAGQSRMDAYRETGVKEYEFVATLDSQTSDICREMDGERNKISDAQPGVNYPPLHAYCRSTTVPVVEDAEPGGERAARKKDGSYHTVPDDMAYGDWEAKHAPEAAKPATPTQTPKAVDPPKVTTVEPDFAEYVPEPQGSETPVPPRLTTPEEAAVIRYIGGESYGLNDKLRRSEPLSGPEMAWVEQLDRALRKLPTFSGDLTRSLHFPSREAVDDYMQDIRPGAVIQYPQYISTSKSGMPYNPVGQIQFYILDALSGRDLEEYNPGELEVLYGRDWPFEVLEIEEIDGVYHILLRELTK